MDHAADPHKYEIIPLVCENWKELCPVDCGLWSETVPPALRGAHREPERYLQAIRRINRVHQEDVLFRSDPVLAKERMRSFIYEKIEVPTLLLALLWVLFKWWVLYVAAIVVILYALNEYKQEEAKRILGLLKKAVGEANTLLCDEDILMGCESNMKLLVMHMPLSACRGHLADQFKSAVMKYSSSYVCHVVRRHVAPAPTSEDPGHLRGGLCFCQYVHRQKI